MSAEPKPDATVTGPASERESLAFLSDENLDREVTERSAPPEAAGEDVIGELDREGAARESASPSDVDAGNRGTHEEGADAPAAPGGESNAPEDVDWKAKYEEISGRYSGAMRELNRRWADEKKTQEAPKPPADPVQERLSKQREILTRKREMIDARREEARKAFPDKNDDDLDAYAEYWGEQDYQDWDTKRKFDDLRKSDPHYQKIVQQEKNERRRELETRVNDIAPILKNPEIKSTFAETLRRSALRLEQSEGTPGRYVAQDGSFTDAFHEHETVVDMVGEAADIAVGRVERSRVKKSVEEAYLKGKADQQEQARKRRQRTIVPVGTGRGSRPGGRSSAESNDDIINSMVSARRF